MKPALVMLLASALAGLASAGVIRNLSDTKATTYGNPVLGTTGSEVLVLTSSNDFGPANPNHNFRIASFDPTTGVGTILSSFSASLSHLRHGFSASDDGQWLAFISDGDLIPGQNGNRSPELFVMMRDGTGLLQLTDDSTPNSGSVSQVAFAGSGNRIAFVSSSDLLGSNTDRTQELYIIDRDGTNLTQMTNTTGGEIEHIGISDDGTRMVYSHNGDPIGNNPEGNYEIFTIAVGDALPRQATSATTGDSRSSTISGDGGTIAFDSTAELSGSNTPDLLPEIYTADWTNLAITRITDGPESRQPSLTDNGSLVFYSSEDCGSCSYEVFSASSDGSGSPTQITTGLVAEHPVVSGDGSQIGTWTGGGLYTIDSGGTTLLELVDRIIPSVGQGDVSVDGQWVAWSSNADPLDANSDGNTEMFANHAEGDQLTQVTDTEWGGGSAVYSGRPAMTADGSRIYMESTASPDGQNPWAIIELIAVDRDGNNHDQLTICPEPGGSSGSWTTGGQPSGDGSKVVFWSSCDFVGQNADRSNELYRMDLDSSISQITNITDAATLGVPRVDTTGNWVVFHSRPFIPPSSVGPYQVWRMQSDGTNLEQLTFGSLSSWRPDVSGDGSRIVFFSQTDPTGQNADNTTEIFLYEPATTTTTQLTVTRGPGYSLPRITADGTYVYFHSDFEFLENDPDPGKAVLYRIHIDSGTLERVGGLTFDESRIAHHPEVSATGDRVVYHSIGNPTGDNPDYSSETFLVDYTALNPIMPSPGLAPTTLSWQAEPGMLRYDVIRGDVANLQHDGGNVDLGTVVCLEDESGDTNTIGFADTANPAPGQAFFYLFRGTMGLYKGAEPYGDGTGGFERVAAAGDCPAQQVAIVCGNGIVEPGELCDGPDVGGVTCADVGFGAGVLACNGTCDGYDTSMCDPPTCGDNICQAFIGEDCVSCESDCNGAQNGNPSNKYCCGDGDGENPVPCSDERCTGGGNTCQD